MRDKERDLQRLLDKKQTELELKQSEKERVQAKLETTENYAETLEKELKETRENVARLMKQVSAGEDTTIKTSQAKNKVEIEVVDLRQQLVTIKDENTRLQN